MARQSSKESTAKLFHRYVWLVDLIYKHDHHITFEEINNRWVSSDLNIAGEDFPLKTFHNHKASISEMFDIDIECDKRMVTHTISTIRTIWSVAEGESRIFGCYLGCLFYKKRDILLFQTRFE